MGIIIDRFGYDVTIGLIAKMRWLIDSGYTIEDMEAECEAQAQRSIDLIKAEKDKELADVQNDPKTRDKIPLCPECGYVLFIKESREEEWESELLCSCGYKKRLDISPMDLEAKIRADVNNEEVEFKPEEIRAKTKERRRRRAVCAKCSMLQGKLCIKCGCSTKHRTYYEILTCPMEKW